MTIGDGPFIPEEDAKQAQTKTGCTLLAATAAAAASISIEVTDNL